MARDLTDRYFTESFSPESIIRRATQNPTQLALPSEYMQPKPDMLSMQTDRLLADMSQGHPGVPYQEVNYAPTPKVTNIPFRRDTANYSTPNIGLPELTELVRKNESSGNYTALNRESAGNTASGAYQYTDATWNGYGGYSKAMLAPKEVQDRRFREDMQARFIKFGGDPFRAIAAHYLPATANDPTTWNNRFYVDSHGRKKLINLSVAEYIMRTLRGTNLQPAFQQYLLAHGAT